MSLDIFEGDYGFWGTILGLFMHNIPALILLAALLISWKKHEIVGGIAFIFAGMLYTILILSRAVKTGFELYYLAWIAQIAGISLLIGVLFVIGWLKKRAA